MLNFFLSTLFAFQSFEKEETIERPLSVVSKKVLVTGGAGFLGIHLCERLLLKGYGVICLDNYSTGTKDNLKLIQHYPNIKIVEHDIMLPFEADVDEIYNLACPASPVHYQKNPITTYKTNIYGALNMLDLAVQKKAKILQASTSEVYGDPEMSPQQESYWGHVNPIGIRACYDEGKRGAETLFFDYERKYKLAIRVVRIFNTYGPYMDVNDGRVVSNFINQALSGKEITVYGDGSQTRSFCYVDDLITGLILMMENEHEKGPVNLGRPGEMKVKDLAELVIALTKSSSILKHLPLPEDDPKQRDPDITKAKTILGWESTVSVKEGLEKTIEYFSKKRNL